MLSFLTGSSKHTLKTVMTNTTDPSYWLNWRFILCALWILTDMIFASFLIWKYEGHSRANVVSEHQRVSAGVLYKDEAWRTCLKGIHPAWLLAFRIFAFVLLLSLIIGNTIADGGGIFVYYTQWTFTLVTIYFGFASVFSIYGCLQCQDKIGYNADRRTLDEHGIYLAPCLGETENAPVIWKSSYDHERHHVLHTAGLFGYLLQIMYQMSAGAVVLTDVVFWLVIFPFLTTVDFKLTFYVVSMHSVNAVLLIDTFLNCMRFPMYRFAYFIFWTSTYVIFQWIIHACINLWWPYPFLDLSSSFAPLWYLGVGLLHIPCYGFFALIVTIKHFWLSRSFPETYRGMR